MKSVSIITYIFNNSYLFKTLSNKHTPMNLYRKEFIITAASCENIYLTKNTANIVNCLSIKIWIRQSR